MHPGQLLLPQVKRWALGTAPLVLALAAVTCWSCGDDPVAPRIERVLPDSGRAGTVVDIVGERFGGSERAVHFGAVAARIQFWQQGRVRVEVPGGPAGLVPLVVTVDGRPSPAADFFVETSPDGG